MGLINAKWAYERDGSQVVDQSQLWRMNGTTLGQMDYQTHGHITSHIQEMIDSKYTYHDAYYNGQM